MTTVAIIIAAVALIVAYLAVRQVGAVDRRLAEIGAALQELRSTVNAAGAKSDEKLTEMRLELRRKAGEAIFVPTMTIKEAMAVHPAVSDVLDSFHLGGCSQCAVSDVDTIEGACQSYGIDQKALMDALVRLVDADGGSARPIDVTKRRLNL